MARTAKQKAALRKAQLASARARRKGGKLIRSQAKYSKRKNVAKGKRLVRNAKNEMKLYKSVGIRTAEKLTGAKSKRSPKKGIAKRFVKGAKTNQAAYKKSTKFAKRVRKNEVRAIIRSR